MHCSKIEQIVTSSSGSEEPPVQLVTGICDYIPFSLKQSGSLSINVDGDYQTIVNSILWSEFFSKTLLKECHHHMALQSYTSQGQGKNNLYFLKVKGKIYKLDQCLRWESQARKNLAKFNDTKGQILIEGFSYSGKAKVINITFGCYSQKGQTDLILKVIAPCSGIEKEVNSSLDVQSKAQLQAESIISNSGQQSKRAQSAISQYGKQPLKKQSSNIKLQNELAKHMKGVNGAIKVTKMAHKNQEIIYSQNKENKSNKYDSRTTQKKQKISAYSSQATHETLLDKLRNKAAQKQLERSYEDSRPSNGGREKVLSKILSGKEQLIISLKEQIKQQEAYFMQLLEEQRAQRKQEADGITQNVKHLLFQYQTTQNDNRNENAYLKERVRVLEDALARRQAQVAAYIQQKETFTSIKRQQEEAFKDLTSSHQNYKEQSEIEINRLKEENQFRMLEMQKLQEKLMNSQDKYSKLVTIMRQSLPE